ncbi:unnamed protein product [Phytophthora lilii]|uniref:Unnamed protein product n=1 Tax=Phytophthora lilii TaxID=2077276 RepID=A0A9W6Y5I8_9STRA|nr:unnamed protein product [Phytophthora lilii]
MYPGGVISVPSSASHNQRPVIIGTASEGRGNRSTQTGSIRTHADYATTDYATVDYATCGYKIVGTRWASTWRSLIG